MSADDEEIFREFLVESGENLDQLDRDFVALESDPTASDRIAGIFRAVHTIKGTSGFLGLPKLEALAHAGERVLFGRPLSHTQAVQLRLAQMVRALATAQLLALQLGRQKQRDALSAAQISLGKWNNCRMALDIARDCRDLLGGAGISVEHVAIRHMLNLESVLTYEGTETIHQLTIGRSVTGIAAF